MKETLAIVYFSMEGSTRAAAEYLQSRLGGDVIALLEQKPGNPIQAILGLSSKLIGTPWEDAQEATGVILLTPIWAGHSAPAVNRFLKNVDFHGRDVTLITVQQSEQLQGSDKVLASMAARVAKHDGCVRGKFALRGGVMGKPSPAEDAARVQEQLETLLAEESSVFGTVVQ